MARPTNTTGYPEKSIYRTLLTSDGQVQVVSSGATLDIYGKFIAETGSSMQLGGNISGSPALTGTMTVGSGGVLRDSSNGEFRFAGLVHHTSNSTEISNHGVKFVHSTEDIKMTIGAPVTGSWVKLVMIPSTIIGTDNSAITVIVTTKTGKGRIIGTSCRQVTFSTNFKAQFSKTIELVGSTRLFAGAKRLWVLANAFGQSSQASQADAVGMFTVSSSTA